MYFLKVIFFSLLIVLGVAVIVFQPAPKTVYFFPGFFDIKDAPEVFFYGENLSQKCREKGFKLKVTRTLKNLKDVHKIIIFDLEGFNKKELSKYHESKLVLFLFEPPTTVPKNFKKKNHKYFSKIFTWDDSLIDGKKYFKFYYPELQVLKKDIKPFSEKKLITMIARNKTSKNINELYSRRIETIRFFEKALPEDFDFYGEGWDQAGFVTYKGRTGSKEILKNYRFVFCYENTQKIQGYITEKIFDSFSFGCVPVYLGAENIGKYIPKNCFIDLREFQNYSELLKFLKNISEEEYEKYLKAIKSFIKSSEAENFSPSHFIKVFDQAIE
jgi:hypothetical protein